MGIETLAIGSLGASAVGSIVGAIGAKSGGEATAASYRYKSAVGLINADIARKQGEVAAQHQDMRTAALLGGQKAAQAASGVDVNTGTAVDVRADSAKLGELDKETLLYNANLKAMGLEQQAKLDKESARYSEYAGELGMFSSLLGGATSVSDKWLNFKSSGVFS